jgi:hypothetical protein
LDGLVPVGVCPLPFLSALRPLRLLARFGGGAAGNSTMFTVVEVLRSQFAFA